MKKQLTVLTVLVLVFSLLCSGALACTSLYVGSALTADGSTLIARSEDISNSYNKVFYVSPAGAHTAGETYTGCYGFTYTFTHDSYGYTAFSDDNGEGAQNICPDCGGEHPHTPYQAAGTNEKGVTVSATETIGASDALYAVDPFEDLGIEEAEITTLLLSEAATAKEAVDLLLSIYDTVGCNGGSGLFIADSNEAWYIENTTGHEYLALKLSDSLVFVQPNMSVIGKIDLDDENVIASAKLIEVAQQAGTFVGDTEANVIDYVASYNADQSANSRMVNSLAYLTGAEPADAPAADAYTISNVDADGNIVPLYTNIALNHSYTIEDAQKYYQIEGIGSSRNLETHIFQLTAEDSLTDTVEWVAMDDATMSVFVPYYPMLTTDTYAGYKLSTGPAAFVTEEPASGLYYATTARQWVDGERVTVEGFKVFPDNWADSFYWSMDALSNKARFGEFGEDKTAAVYDAMNAKQADINAAFAAFQADVIAADPAAAAELATSKSAEFAADVHALSVQLLKDLIGE